MWRRSCWERASTAKARREKSGTTRVYLRWSPLEALRKFNGTAMDVEDTWFSKPAYAWALAGYLKANGVDAQALNDGTVDARLMDQARAYAIREAQRATYRDSNAFSEFVSGLRRKGNSPVDRTVNVLMEGVFPFRKTPANILMAGGGIFPGRTGEGIDL